METTGYLFSNPDAAGACGVPGICVFARSLRQARAYMRRSTWRYTRKLRAGDDLRDWQAVDAHRVFTEALACYIANGGGDPEWVRREYCLS